MEIGMELPVLGKAPYAPRPGFLLSKQGWDPQRGTGWLMEGESAAQGWVPSLS